jgi:DNA polymerase elongation subunit (family B)
VHTSPLLSPNSPLPQDEWLWGWDPTPGIVSVWAEPQGRALIWRRQPGEANARREEARFRPWVLLANPDDVRHAVTATAPNGAAGTQIDVRELDGPGELRFLASAPDWSTLTTLILEGASRRLGRRVPSLRDMPDDELLALPLDEQYLVSSGRVYFRDLSFDDLRRLQFDLETTGLDASRDRIFMIAVRSPEGAVRILETTRDGDAGEADLLRQLMDAVAAADPDVIENHNLHGFDLPFVETRARRLRIPLVLGRIAAPGLRRRGARRGASVGNDDDRRTRFVAPGRELIDTMDAVRRYDRGTRELPSYGLKALARHFGISGPERELIPGAEIHRTYRTDPERVRRYAAADVVEVAALSRMLGGAAFALARMTPRRYERLADAGAATGVIDPLLVRAYLHAGTALPAHRPSDGTVHSGAALHLFATGVAHRVVKADVASLYPSLMRTYRIGPKRDRLGALLAIVDRLVDLRLAAKAGARAATPGTPERHTFEAMSAAMKLVVNSAYGYLGASGELTRFADVHAANEVTRRGRKTLTLMCRALAERGVTLIEADTDGVYFAVPPEWTEDDERRVVAEIDGLLPPLVHLELEGRYAAMLSHEPKNYALLERDGELVLRGVAFRSSRMEPFAEAFLRAAIGRLLAGDVPGVRAAYLTTLDALRVRALPTHAVSSRVRLTKSPAEYLATRATRRELPYEAMIAAGRSWRAGDRVRVYRTRTHGGAIVDESEIGAGVMRVDPRDYDAAFYARQLRQTFAPRLARAFTREDFAVVFAEPDQYSLFAPAVEHVRPVLTRLDLVVADGDGSAEFANSD